MHKNYKSEAAKTKQATEEFQVKISKNFDGRTFSIFIKHLNELKRDVIEHSHHELSPDSFLIFLDKIRDLTHSQSLNEMILNKLVDINVDQLKTHQLLNTY